MDQFSPSLAHGSCHAISILFRGCALAFLAAVPALAQSGSGSSGSGDGGGAPPSLRNVTVPLPGNLDQFVQDRRALLRLGKALFWDEQTGGDGNQACATCHFSSGVDSRTTNTFNPGRNGVFDNGVTPGETLTAANFPTLGDDIVGSQGVVRSDFVGIDPNPANAADLCTLVNDGVFFPNRQVTGRNAPSTIMAIFNRDNFWDGRAKREFNGVNPAGAVSPPPTILVDNGNGLQAVSVIISPASAASQAVGPPNNGTEMSCTGRTFAQLGRKLLARQPLGHQQVDTTDSVLGSLSASPGNGLTTTYAALINQAFRSQFRASSSLTQDGFTQMEANFSLFWGLAVLMYESTLVPDQSPFDQWRNGGPAISSSARAGLSVFNGAGRCNHCHTGSEFTSASISGGRSNGFFNTGVTPTAQDGGQQPQNQGKFKTATLRNIELTGPYFHNGRYSTLRQVVDFYNRGGDVHNAEIDSQIRPLGLSSTDRDNLVSFMLTLTDDRVRFSRAPFDHPSL
jgi:cytochrome c peroxidase